MSNQIALFQSRVITLLWKFFMRLAPWQCDQMTKLCFQYLAIFSNENLPNRMQIVPKGVENDPQNQINLKYITKDF